MRETAKATWPRKCASAVVMGAAIAVMHYTGMAAARFTPSTAAVDLAHAVHVSPLGIAGISSVSLLVLGIVSVTSLVDRRFSAQTMALAEERTSAPAAREGGRRAQEVGRPAAGFD